MRIISRKFVVAAAVLAVAAATVTALIGPAAADPPAGVTPALTDQVALGSDTMQALTGAGTLHWNAQVPAPAFYSYSWETTGSAQIMAKATCNPTGNPAGIPRPAGSSQGLAALNATTTTNQLINGHRACVDVARSARAPLGDDSTKDSFFALARDAVGWAGFTSTSTVQTDSPQTLSYRDLVRIYNCTYVSWNQIKDVPGYAGPNVAIKVFLPPAGSDSRSGILQKLGIADNGTHACWQTATPMSNEGTDPVFNDPSVIFPYSVGHYIGQKYHGMGVGSDNSGYLDADRSISRMGDDQPGTSCSTATGCAQVDPTNHVIGTDFSNTCFGHLLYYVALTADWNAPQTPGSESAALHLLFNKATDPSPGWVCVKNDATSPVGSAARYGFLPLSANDCGTISLGR
jgi:ABC-type phosphate transport system substrate-binding protein